MSRERYTYNYGSAAQKSWISRAAIALLVLLAIALLIMARSHHPALQKIRAQMLGIVSPVMSTAAKPMGGFRALMTNKDALLNAFEENKSLRAENDTLRQWQAVAQALKAENEALRNLASYHPVESVKYVTARVIGQSPGDYSATLMLNIGSADGVELLQPVIDAQGLIGRISELGEHSARVLLLSNALSRVPVITANTRQHAILAGTSEELLHLTFIGGNAATIALGEPVVTTEEGGLIPGGVMVGTVFRRDETGLLVKPMRPLAQAEYVRVITK